MKSRFEAKTIEDAIIKAETELGMSRDAFTVDVINEDSKGFLGIGAKDAVIEVIYDDVNSCNCSDEDHEHGEENYEIHDDGNGSDAEHIIILKNFLDEFLGYLR